LNPKFVADENIPFQVIKALREVGYEAAILAEVAQPGIRNEELAKLSMQLKRTIITRDADFTHLKQSLIRKIKVIYVRLSGDPNDIAQQVVDNIERCVSLLREHNVIIINKKGCYTL
jgi:predicted nuclease of predicted toxin-antitoxin system